MDIPSNARYKWTVYLLQREKDDEKKPTGQGSREFYVGMTNDLLKRLLEHNSGKCPATKGNTWTLEGIVICKDRAEAGLLERWFKVGDSRQKRLNLITCMTMGENAKQFALKQMLNKAHYWKTNKALLTGFGLNAGSVTRETEKETNHA